MNRFCMECLCVSMCLHVWFVWSVSMSSCGYGHEVSPCSCVSPCLHVDRDTECLHVSMCVSMSPCRYGYGVSPCGYRHRVYYELHGDFHVDMDSHMEISMVMDRYCKVWYSSMWGIMYKYEAISNSVCYFYIKYLIVKSFYYKSSKWKEVKRFLMDIIEYNMTLCGQ